MHGMFNGATSFNSDISQWDTSRVNLMGSMFLNAISFNSVLSRWVTSRVLNMGDMFAGTPSFNSNLSQWDTSNVIDMSRMFYNATSFNGDVSQWNTSRVNDMQGMFFYATSFNGNVSQWDTSNVNDTSFMFQGASRFNGNLSQWNTSRVRNMYGMFFDAASFNGDISEWDTSNVSNMISMFRNASSFNGDVSRWDTSGVTHMLAMFYNAASFNGNVSQWDTSSVTDMRVMFYNATNFNQNVSSWNTSKLSTSGMALMFQCASSFEQHVCWSESTSDEWLGFQNMFCGSDGRLDPSCATTAQVNVSGCFSTSMEAACAPSTKTQSDAYTTSDAWYKFTIPVSSAYIAAVLNVLLEIVIILSVSQMFRRFETRQVSKLLRNADPIQIEELEWPLLGEGLLVRKGVRMRALLRLLLLVAIWTAEFSSEGQTEMLMETKEAVVVGNGITIFETRGEGTENNMTHFSAKYVDGPRGILKQAEAACTEYYQSAIGLRRVALIGTTIEEQLRAEDFKCIGDEIVTVTDNAVLGDQCRVVVFPDYKDMNLLWNVADEAARANIPQSITVYSGTAEYEQCEGSLRDGFHPTLVGINKAGEEREKQWSIVKAGGSYYLSTFSGDFSMYPDVREEGSVKSTQRVEVETDLQIAHLLVKTMIDTGLLPFPDFLSAISEAWYTNRGSENSLTNVIVRESGTAINFFGETGNILNQTERTMVEFPTGDDQPVTEFDARYLLPVICVVVIYLLSLFFPRGEFELNRLNFVSKLFDSKITDNTAAEFDYQSAAYATVGLENSRPFFIADQSNTADARRQSSQSDSDLGIDLSTSSVATDEEAAGGQTFQNENEDDGSTESLQSGRGTAARLGSNSVQLGQAASTSALEATTSEGAANRHHVPQWQSAAPLSSVPTQALNSLAK
jgi:surface protein